MPAALPARAIVESSKELARVLKRLDALDKAMNKRKLDPKQWDMLTRAYERLFKAWMVLSGTPGSGQRKPTTIRSGRSQSYPMPEVMPEPLPVGDSKGENQDHVKHNPPPPTTPAATTPPQPVVNCGVQPGPSEGNTPQAEPIQPK